MTPRLQQVVIIAVLAVWIANFAARFFVAGYEPAPQIDAIFMAIAGGAYALNRGEKSGGNGKHKGEDPK